MSETRSILIVEDEADLAETIAFHLRREGFACRVAHDGQRGLAEAQRELPDLIVLDRMLPRLSGDEVATRLRADPRTARLSILMLTAKAEESDELVGLALGADDYVRKPVSMKLLVARIQALLRRETISGQPAEVLCAGPLRLDQGRHELAVDGVPVPLTATEFRILAALMAARGRVLERDRLIDTVLGERAVTQRAIDVHVAGLRKKLGAAAAWICTVRGVGYAFRAPAAAPEAS